MAEIKNNQTTEGKDVVIENAFDNGMYELGITNRLNEISSLTVKKEEDYQMLSGYVYENQEMQNITFGISDTIRGVVAELQKLKEMMEAELTGEPAWNQLTGTAVSSFQSGRTGVVDMLQSMIDPLTAAVATLQSNILTKMGIPEIPVIGNIQQIIVKVGQIGRVVSRLPASTREEARKRKQEEEAAAGGSALYRLYNDSILDKIITEMVEAFKQALELLYKIITLIEPFLIMMLIEKLKPVIDYFGLMLGEIYGIAENAYTIGKMVIFNQAQLLNLFAQAIREKVEELWDVLRYVIHGGELPHDAMISAVCMDLVCCDFDISANNLDIDLIRANQSLYDEQKTYDKLSEIISKKSTFNILKGAITKGSDEWLRAAAMKNIQTLSSVTIPSIGQKILDFNANRSKNFQDEYANLVKANLAKFVDTHKKPETASPSTT